MEEGERAKGGGSAERFERGNREGRDKEQAPRTERLSPEEALVYQEYATKKGGIPFSEQAEEESYREAEEFLMRLRDRQFDFLDIRWDSLDLSDPLQRETIQERLQAAVYELAKSSGNERILREFEEQPRKHGSAWTTFLVSSLITLSSLAPAFGQEKNLYEVNERPAPTEILDHLKALRGKVFSPHFEFDKEGRFRWDNLWKIVLEPVAVAVAEKLPERQKIEIRIPYEYSRLFDTGRPIDQEDYDKLNAHIESKLLEELKENILAFSWDKEALENNHPEFLEVDKTRMTRIDVMGSASPEARVARSESPGAIDEENVTLAGLRAENAVNNVRQVLDKLGIAYDPTEISASQIEIQFSDPEMEALEQIARRYDQDTFGLIKEFNRGQIRDVEDSKVLETIVASKRKVLATFETEAGAPRGVVIPLPLLLGLLPFIRLPRVRGQRREFSLPLPRPRILWRDFQFPLPRPKIAWKDLLIERYRRREIETSDLEIKKVEVLYDILQSTDFYEQIARRHIEDEDLEDEHKSIGNIASDILGAWESTDNATRQEQGIHEQVDYFSNDRQKLYAELHAVVVRSMVMRMKKGRFIPTNIGYRRKELEEIIDREFERYKQ